MPKITFIGAGSTVFAKNILGDCMLKPSLQNSEVALYDIDKTRLSESYRMLQNLNGNMNKNRMKIKKYLGIPNRKKALQNADYVFNGIQVGGYKPSTVIDFEVPQRYGLRQTIADTLGIGGIFRALRTAPVMIGILREMEIVCPNALFLTYTNPMSILTGAMLRASDIRTIGLCHSVQVCVKELFARLKIESNLKDIEWEIAGINHMAWLLKIEENGRDMYPRIKKLAAKMNRESIRGKAKKHDDMIRFEMMKYFGYYITESSEHNAEYTPYWIKNAFPELIEKFNIPLNDYPRRCEEQIADWKNLKKEIVSNRSLKHKKSREYGSDILDAIETNKPFVFWGNVLNKGQIENLPAEAIVEIKCVADKNGISPAYKGRLPEQLAALNRTNINVHLLAIEAIMTGRKDYIYQAAMLDPHTAAELPLDKIKSLCDDMIKAHEGWLPEFK